MAVMASSTRKAALEGGFGAHALAKVTIFLATFY
jgi:hypothetical protein